MNTGLSDLGQRPEYEVRLTPHAERDLQRLSHQDFRRVDERIFSLAENPRPMGVIKLRDKAHRVRVGPWRVIYLIDDSKRIVLINAVRRREKDTYRSQ